MNARVTSRGRLFRKYVIVFSGLVCGVLLASGGVEIYFSYQENREALVALQREKALGVASRIEGFITEIERQIGFTIQPHFGAPEAALAQRRIDYLRLQRQSLPITEVSYIDGQGLEQQRVSRLAMEVVGSQTDFSRDPKFVEAKARGVYYGPVTFRKDSEPYMTIAIAGSGKGAGVTVADVNLKFIWDVVSKIKIGKAGHAFVLDREGLLIAHPDMSLVLQKTSFAGLDQVKAALAGAPAPADRRQQIGIARDSKNRRVMTAYATIGTLGWSVFVEQPLDEALASLYDSIQRTIILLVLGILLAVAASLLLVRRMVTPIQALQAGAVRIGAGELDQRIDVHTGDELEALGDQFNQMAAQLKESYAGLERKVEERTHELTRSVGELRALGEVGQAVNSSLDLETVLATIASRARELSSTDGGAIYEYDEQTEEFHLRATQNFEPEFAEVLRNTPIRRGEGITGRMVETREVTQIPDVLEDSSYQSRLRDTLVRAGYRALLAVPLLSEDRIIGGLVVNRKTPGEFSPEVIELLRTFATQSALAIQNARLFQEIEEKGRQLEIANRHKSEFLASMSHELRTPLNAVIGFSEVLLERMFGEINEKQDEYLQDILSSGRHLLSLINDILDLAKIEAGRMDLDVTDFHLPQAIDNAITLVKERAARRAIVLQAAVDPRLGEIKGDERKVKQVLLNLLSNAIKFTPEGGRVDVAATLAGDVAEISVTDTGVGIAAEDHEAVFEEFRQVGTDYAKKHEGTGLGLTLSRRFVELHGGRIWVKSELGQGATFTFTLPVGPWRTSSS